VVDEAGVPNRLVDLKGFWNGAAGLVDEEAPNTELDRVAAVVPSAAGAAEAAVGVELG
jgi:hypothetical protein